MFGFDEKYLQVLSFEQGWSVQPRSKPAAAEDQEERCWKLLKPQVFKSDAILLFKTQQTGEVYGAPR